MSPRPTCSFGFGSRLLSHSRGDSIAPAARTTIFACSVVVSLVRTFRHVTPADYVARHGSEMVAFTYDDYTYADARLQTWLDEVGRLLRSRPSEPDR